jgi:hypothetical protein
MDTWKMKSQQNKGKHDTSMINRRRKEKKCDSLWCPPGPAQVGKLFRVGTRPPSPNFPVRHRPPLHLISTATTSTSTVATPARSRRRNALYLAPLAFHSFSTRPFASLLRFVPPPQPLSSRSRWANRGTLAVLL